MAVASTRSRPVVPTVKLNGAEPGAALGGLVSARIHVSVDQPGRAELVYEAEKLNDALAQLTMGQPVEVLLPTAEFAMTSVLVGELAAIEVRDLHGAEGTTALLALEVWDASHRLAGASDFTAYLDQKRSDVVQAVAGRHGLSAEVESTQTVEPYLLQSGTDHAFLGELADAVGFEWFVRGTTLHFRKRPESAPTVTLRPGSGDVRLTLRYEATSVPSEVTVLGWNTATDAAIAATSGDVVGDSSLVALGSDATFVTRQYEAAKSSFGKPLLVPVAPSMAADDAGIRSKAIARQLSGRGLRLEGHGRAEPKIVAGGVVEVQAPESSLAGRYYVTEVEHTYDHHDGSRTRFVSRGSQPTAPPGPPAGTLADWSRTGLALGRVTNVNDEEGFGRVKVVFAALGDHHESAWARVVSPGAGEERGLDLRPSVGDEVLVGFERGDPRSPYVLGGVWGKGHLQPDVAAVKDSKLEKWVLQSPAGHKLEFVEGDTKAVDVETANGKTKLHLGDDDVVLETAADQPLTIKAGGSTIEFGADGALKITCKSLTVESEGAAEIKAKQALTLKGMELKAEAQSAFTVKGAQGTVQAQGPMAVKGAVVQIN